MSKGERNGVYELPNKFGDYGLDYSTELKGWNYKIASVWILVDYL